MITTALCGSCYCEPLTKIYMSVSQGGLIIRHTEVRKKRDNVLSVRKEDIKVALALVTFSQVYICQAQLWLKYCCGNHQGIVYAVSSLQLTFIQIMWFKLGTYTICPHFFNGALRFNVS